MPLLPFWFMVFSDHVTILPHAFMFVKCFLQVSRIILHLFYSVHVFPMFSLCFPCFLSACPYPISFTCLHVRIAGIFEVARKCLNSTPLPPFLPHFSHPSSLSLTLFYKPHPIPLPYPIPKGIQERYTRILSNPIYKIYMGIYIL